MSDINQAALLEILAGKTRSNTAAAILSNTKDLEAAYAQALDAEGSALRENEKYLDSIQGKIDQFNNAVQTMWSNTLDSDIVKGIVDIGTGLIKIVDNLGLINTLVFGLMGYLTVFKKDKLDLASLLGIHDVEKGWTLGKEGVSGWVAKKIFSHKKQPIKQNNDDNIIVQDDNIAVQAEAEQLSLFSDEYETQRALNEKIHQLNVAKSELKSLKQTKWKDIQIPDDAIAYKTGNRKRAYMNEVLIPNKEQEIVAIEKDIDDITMAAKVKIEQAKINLKEGANGQFALDVDSALKQKTPSKYLDMFENGLGQGTEKLTYDTKQLGAELDKLNHMDNSGVIDYMTSLDELGDVSDATKRVLAGYASTVQDGNYTLQGAQRYVNQYNQSLKHMGKEAQIARFKQNMLNLAISACSMLVTILITKLIESATAAQDEFDKLSSRLSSTESELKSIESELNTINDTIEEIQNKGTLSFTDREELERLQAQGAELKRQKDLQEQIQKQQQKGVNNASVKAANEYAKNKGVNTGKTTGEIAGQGAQYGAMAGGAIAAAGGGAALVSTAVSAGIITAGTALAGPLGTVLASLLIAGVGAAVGAGIGAGIGAAEEKVGDSLDNMKERYSKLQEEYEAAQSKYANDTSDKNYDKMVKAQEKLIEYESMMANHLSDMNSYYSQIDLSVYDPVKDAEEIKRLRQEMNDFYDTQDKWAIETGGQNAKTNALNRIFGENADEQLKAVKEDIMEALESGDEVDLEKIFGSSADFETFRKRMYNMGIYMTDVINYVKDFKEEKEAAFDSDDIMGVVKSINRVSDAISSLNDAIAEINENGILSAKTLETLNKTFGGMEGVSDEWNHFVKVMTSAQSTTFDMTKATEGLVEAWLDAKLITSEMSDADLTIMAMHLKELGIDNAEQYIQDAYKEKGFDEIAKVGPNRDTVIEEFKKKLNGTGFTIDDYDLSSDENIKTLAKELNITQIDIDKAKEVAKAYGITNEELEEYIDILKRKAKAESDYTSAQKKLSDYQTFFDGDNGYNKLKDRLDYSYDQIKDEYEKFSDRAKNFDPTQYVYDPDRLQYVNMNDPYFGSYRGNPSDVLSDSEYNELVKESQKFNVFVNQIKDEYDAYIKAKTEFEQKIKEGTDLGFIVNGEPNLEISEESLNDAVESADNVVNQLQDKIESDATNDVDLELELKVTLAKTGTVFDEYTSAMETLASIQSEVANGFIISAEKAREFAAVYPEILKGATIAANGQIQLESNTVNAVLEGERAKQNAAIETQITNLRLQIEESKSKIAFYEAQLLIAEAAAKSEDANAWQLAQSKLTASNVLLGALINNGVDEEQAYEIVTQNMSEDTNEFQDIVKYVSETNFTNMNNAAIGAATSLAMNANAMQQSLIAIAGQAQKTAEQVGAIANGEVIEGATDKVSGITYGDNSTMPEFIAETMTFDTGNTSEKVENEETPDLKALFGEILDPEAYGTANEYVNALKNAIATESTLMDSYSGRIALLESVLNSPLSYFDPNKDQGLNGSDDGNGNGVADSDEFQEAMDYWENRIAASQARYQQVQNEIDLLESKGLRANEEHYKKQIELENERRELLEGQRAEAQAYLNHLEATGQEGSEEWWNTANILNGIEEELDSIIKNVWDLYDAIAQLNKELSEETHERISNLTTDLENIRDILSSEDMFDEEGNFTEAGVANLATYIDEIARYKDGIEQIDEELNSLGTWEDFSRDNAEHLDLVRSDIDISKAYEGNEDYFKDYGINSAEEYKAFTDFLAKGITSEQEFYDEMTRLTDQRDEYTKGIKDSEQAVVEMYENQIDAIEEYTSKLVDSYNDYIDNVKEALDAERELYEFKKNVEKQTKNIATLERRIASLSGSTKAEDIAERRRLEAELLEAKEGLNDTYYSNAKDSQQNALDSEAQAYEETMNRYIEGLRDKLKEATEDVTTFVGTVAGNVVANADVVYKKYNETNLALDDALVQPWEDAAAEIKKFGGSDGALEKMNSWTKKGGDFDIFKDKATKQLKSPWTSGKNAVTSFGNRVKSTMKTMYDNIKSNVTDAITELNKLKVEIGKVNDNPIRISSGGNGGGGNGNNPPSGGGNSGNVPTTGGHGIGGEQNDVKKLQRILVGVYQKSLNINGVYGTATRNALKEVQKTLHLEQDGKYGSTTRKTMSDDILNRAKISVKNGQSDYAQKLRTYHSILPPAFYAKGTIGTDKDEWAITDEPWLGDELVLVPTAQGNLSYMRKGTSVVPAAITENLVEWGKLNPNMMSAGVTGANVNMISNAVNKPEFNIDVENFLRCDHVSQDTLPELKKFVNEQMNSLMRQLNYGLKRSGAR